MKRTRPTLGFVGTGSAAKKMRGDDGKPVPRHRHPRIEGVPLSEQYEIAKYDGAWLDESPHPVTGTRQHLYRVDEFKDDGGTAPMSVSRFRARFFPVFKADEIAKEKVGSGRYRHCRTPEEIKAMWQEGSDLGTDAHNNIEFYYDGKVYDINREDFKRFEDFMDAHPHITAACVEKVMYDPVLRIAGTIDAGMRYLRFPKDDPIMGIYDWKRARALYMRGYQGAMCTHPITKHLHACNYQEYRISMCLYKYMYERYYDGVVPEMVLIGIHPRHHTYERHPVYSDRDLMNEIVADRIRDFLVRGTAYPWKPLRQYRDGDALEDYNNYY